MTGRRLDDPAYVERQYRSAAPLLTRASVWRPAADGRWPQDVVLAALGERQPARVLEVGAGSGTLAARLAHDLRCAVVATDRSPQMVAHAAALGLEAQVADVQALPFDDGAFDAAVAAWMLYHVADLDRGLAELARVLRPGGTLVAVTNGEQHLAELWRAVGAQAPRLSFSRENGAGSLRRHFARVERIDLETSAIFPDREAAAAYLASIEQEALADRLGPFETPLLARGTPTIFVAER